MSKESCYTNITPAVGLFVFMLVIIISFIISYCTSASQFKYTKTRIFLNCFSALGFLLVFIFYISVIQLQRIQIRANIIETTSRLNKSFLKGFVDNIHTVSKQIPHFISSLFPLQDINCDKEDENNIENNLLKHKIAYKIFSHVQEILVASPFIEIDQTAFLAVFLQRCTSKELNKIWCNIKLEFNNDTQILVELLFNHASKISDYTADNFICAAEKLKKDQIFIKVINE